MQYRELLVDSFRAALTAADPLRIVPPHLPAPPRGKTIVVGAGNQIFGTNRKANQRLMGE